MVYFYLLFILFSVNPFIQTLSIMQTSPKQTLSILRYEHPKILKVCLAVFQHYTSKDWYESFKGDMHTVHPVTHDHFCVHTISCLFTQFKSLMINFEPRIKRWNTLKWVYGSKVGVSKKVLTNISASQPSFFKPNRIFFPCDNSSVMWSKMLHIWSK